MIITLKGATASKNLGGLNFYSILVNKSSGVTVTLDKTTVDKATASSTTVTGTLTVAEGYTLDSVKIMMGDTDKTSAWYNSSTGAITISSITANVVITAVATSNSGSGEEDEPTNYTFTINPTPDSATVTLTAAGYTQSGNSITVPNGTSVSWRVSAGGYTEQTGTWTANGSDETLPVTLDKESGGGDAENIAAYIQEGKAIIKAGELTDNSAFFSVVNYPVKGATYYLIPYARNAYCLTAAGATSGGMLTGGGSETATLRAAGTAATMSICFKYDDISPSDVTITETVAPA